ncbi:SigB/SigF/SigG family RNA polymerase sigma factor [Mycobacteroides salmoniphilum]|uniref:SigB/SigF/SigG family RNA polymerase sigma factor n=1 Tax=Mycobacteroides salmoniphilum TaxID=404941 RepID=UPI000991CE61|nr:SigB/SigF/SigG family RNA polymerase sigma factor [Mycobacteroides salmoniphilum]QCH23968.1 RNA polymerase sigma factor SigF [Mycobacteroides salmoniphilum]
MECPVDAPETGRTEARSKPSGTSDDYSDVPDMFLALRDLPPDSPAYHRLREQIVTRCLHLADNVARHFDRRGEDLEDLTQVARVGLLNAVNRFDPEKGSSFLGFAVPTMMGEVRRHFRDHSWSMHVPRSIRDRHAQIARATAELTQNLQRSPTASELATELGISREEVVESLVAADAYQPQSIDAPVAYGDDESKHLADLLGDNDPALEHVTNREAVRPLLAGLPPRERIVLELRFFKGMTQSQIAEQIGVSQMHVSRILSDTLRYLREQLQ